MITNLKRGTCMKIMILTIITFLLSLSTFAEDVIKNRLLIKFKVTPTKTQVLQLKNRYQIDSIKKFSSFSSSYFSKLYKANFAADALELQKKLAKDPLVEKVEFDVSFAGSNSILPSSKNVNFTSDPFLKYQWGLHNAAQTLMYDETDIKSIKIPWYIDESNKYRKWSFTDYIKWTQWNDIIKIDVELLFYVKWYPHYKLEQLIIDILDQYDFLVKDINKKLKVINNNNYNLSKYKKINNYLKWISNDIKSIRTLVNNKKENIDNIYNNAIKYKYILENINKILSDEV